MVYTLLNSEKTQANRESEPAAAGNGPTRRCTSPRRRMNVNERERYIVDGAF